MKDTLLKAVAVAGKIIQQNFNGVYNITNKEGANNPVTEIDEKSERAIIEVIKSDFPTHQVLSEECGELVQDSSYKWIIDPIDGTVNFAHGLPICCVSIGIEKEGEIVMGAVYNPFMNELYFAEKCAGAYLNQKKIQVSKVDNVMRSCLVTGFPYTYVESSNSPLDVFARFIKKGIAVRRLGSAALDLCWVAAGRFDGYFEHKLNPWDAAAGILLVKEAGGYVTNFENEKYSIYEAGMIASNGLIHEELVGYIHP